MSDFGTFIDNTLKPSIFQNLSRIFPEMEWKWNRGEWESSKGLFGREPHSPRHDKSRVTKRQPTRVIEQGGDSIELIEYYQKLNNLPNREEAISAICNILGLTPPPMQDSPQYAALS